MKTRPGCSHGGGASLSFADGHTELKKWLDPRTTPPCLTPIDGSYPAGTPSPNNRDIRWLQVRCTRKIQYHWSAVVIAAPVHLEFGLETLGQGIKLDA